MCICIALSQFKGEAGKLFQIKDDSKGMTEKKYGNQIQCVIFGSWIENKTAIKYIWRTNWDI